METLVSVCMTNYNYENFIKETIDSVLFQTYKNFEFIIIDNASTDGSVKIINSYDDPRIKLHINEKKIPLYQNLNKAAALAQGELVTFLHSDDIYNPLFLSEIVKAKKNNPNKKVFVSGVYFWQDDKNEFKEWCPYKDGGIKAKHETLLNLSVFNVIGNGVNVAIDKECLNQAGGFSEKYMYSADYDLWFRLAGEHEFVYINKLLTYYRVHNSNLPQVINKNLDTYKESLSVTNKVLGKLDKTDAKLFDLAYFSCNIHLLNKILKTGIKHKSGEMIRNMLKYTGISNPAVKKDPFYYFVYNLSYLLGDGEESMGSVLLNFIEKVVFYPRRTVVRRNMQKKLQLNCS